MYSVRGDGLATSSSLLVTSGGLTIEQNGLKIQGGGLNAHFTFTIGVGDAQHFRARYNGTVLY